MMEDQFAVTIFEVMEYFKIKELPQLGEFLVNLMEWPTTNGGCYESLSCYC